MKKELCLKDLVKIRNAYLILNNDFVKDLLISASDSYPPKNKLLAKRIKVKFNEKYRISPTILGWYQGRKNLPLIKIHRILKISKKYNWKDVERNFIGIKSHGAGQAVPIKPQFPIELNEELGSIIGHIFGDGWIDNRFSQPCYCNTNKELLKEFQDSMKTVFRAKPRIMVQKSNNFETKSEWLGRVNKINEIDEGKNATLFYPKIVGQILHLFLGDFAKGKKKTITKNILNSPNNFKKRLLRAFFDDEGSVLAESHYMRLHQDSKEILESMRNLLSEFKIESNPIRTYIKRNKERYYFSITGYINYSFFHNKIGFTSSSKSKNLEQLVNKVKDSSHKHLYNSYNTPL